MARPAQEWEAYRSERLHDAAASGDLACVDKLLSEGTDPDWVNPATGLTPLLIASMYGRAETVRPQPAARRRRYLCRGLAGQNIARAPYQRTMLKNMCARVNQESIDINSYLW